nr:hypothetical protein [Anaerobium acetethylicum]
MGVPAIMIIHPLFGIVANWNRLNNILANKVALIFMYVGLNIPYTTIFLLAFFSNLPGTFEEAAAIGRCSPRFLSYFHLHLSYTSSCRKRLLLA